MKSKGLQTILYSTVGVAAVALVVIGCNIITASFKQRVDLTDEKAYTLSGGTRAILTKLDTPVKIRLLLHAERAIHARDRVPQELRFTRGRPAHRGQTGCGRQDRD